MTQRVRVTSKPHSYRMPALNPWQLPVQGRVMVLWFGLRGLVPGAELARSDIDASLVTIHRLDLLQRV